jgi:hypothetical protein
MRRGAAPARLDAIPAEGRRRTIAVADPPPRLGAVIFFLPNEPW